MDIILTTAGGFVAGLLVAAWRLRGDRGFVKTLQILSGGPRPTVPK